MDPDRIHRAVSADGTEFVGRAHGQGPPLVLVHAGLGDGDLGFGALLRCSKAASPATCRAPAAAG